MGLIVKGLRGIKRQFRRTEEKASRASLNALRKAALIVTLAARQNAPIDEGDLEKAIVSIERRERTALGRFGSISIQVGVDKGLLELDRRKGFDYSVPMHESTYNLGPLSQEKQNMNPGFTVGPKYLDRAWRDNEERIRAQVAESMRQGIKGP